MWWLWLAARQRVRSVHAAQLITRAEQKLQLTSRGCIQPRPAQHLLSLTTFVLLDFACKLRTCEYCSMLHFGFSQESEHVVTQFSTSPSRHIALISEKQMQIFRY